MAMNSLQLKGIIVDRNKSKIIKSYKDGTKINIIAGEYNINMDTLRRRFKKWGVKIRKGDFKRGNKTVKHFKRYFSPELRIKMAKNSWINDIFIEPCKFEHTTEDQKLVSNILNHPIIG